MARKATTLRDVREGRTEMGFEEVYDLMHDLARDQGLRLRDYKLSGARQLARVEQYPVASVRQIIVALYLEACGTTISAEFPELDEQMTAEVRFLAAATSGSAKGARKRAYVNDRPDLLIHDEAA